MRWRVTDGVEEGGYRERRMWRSSSVYIESHRVSYALFQANTTREENRMAGQRERLDTYRRPNSISIPCTRKPIPSWTCPLPLDPLWYISDRKVFGGVRPLFMCIVDAMEVKKRSACTRVCCCEESGQDIPLCMRANVFEGVCTL